ncbi:MAG: hypothetical protein J7L62_06995 [Candidatus Aminicenantes bacterium]|nr:hypothetical protein [Candidatus Aminicenantes bacterium]
MKKWILFLFIVGVLSNLLLIKGPFLWDDDFFIVNNPHIKRVELKNYFTSPYWMESSLTKGFKGFYRPLVPLSFAIDYKIYGLRSWGFHLTNIIFHLASSILLFFVLIQIGLKDKLSFYASAIFSSASTIREAVAWISSRGDVLALFFILLSLYLFLKRKDFMSVFFFMFALFSKEVSIVFPVFLVTLLFYRRENLKRVILFFVADFLFLVVRSLFTSSSFLLKKSIFVLADRAIKAMGFYFVQGAFPFTGKVFISPVQVFSQSLFYIPALIFVVLAISFFVKREKIFLFPAFHAVLLLPALSAVLFAIPHSVAFRYGYIPSAFLISFSVLLISKFERIGKIVLPFLLIASIINANIINFYWTSEELYWEKAHMDAPDEPFFAIKLAIIEYQKGNVQKSINILRPYISPPNTYTPKILDFLAFIEESRGNLREAESLLKQALQFSKKIERWEVQTYGEIIIDKTMLYRNLSRVLLKEGKVEEAVLLLESGFKKYGDNPDYKDQFAIALALAGRCYEARELAIKWAQDVMKICNLWEKGDPYSMAIVYSYRKQFEKAKKFCNSLKEGREKCIREIQILKKRLKGE